MFIRKLTLGLFTLFILTLFPLRGAAMGTASQDLTVEKLRHLILYSVYPGISFVHVDAKREIIPMTKNDIVRFLPEMEFDCIEYGARRDEETTTNLKFKFTAVGKNPIPILYENSGSARDYSVQYEVSENLYSSFIFQYKNVTLKKMKNSFSGLTALIKNEPRESELVLVGRPKKSKGATTTRLFVTGLGEYDQKNRTEGKNAYYLVMEKVIQPTGARTDLEMNTLGYYYEDSVFHDNLVSGADFSSYAKAYVFCTAARLPSIFPGGGRTTLKDWIEKE